MIQMPNQEDIRKHHELQKARIADQFIKPEKIEKSITLEDFQKSYPSDKFEFYHEKAIEDFKADFKKSEYNDPDELWNSLASLKKILVSKGEENITFYVKSKE